MKLAYMVATPEVHAFPYAWLGPADDVLPKIAELGYHGVEIQTCDPSAFEPFAFRRALERHDLDPVGVGTGPIGRQDGLYLIHADDSVRARAVERYHAVIDLAADWHVPAAIGRGRGLLSSAPSPDVGMQWWRQALDELLEHAERRGINLLLEPQNRYNADLLVTIDETVTLLEEVGSSRLLLEGDTYHQALEERSVVASYIRAGSHLGHMQLADTNRLSPGRGTLNWVDVLETLQAIGYDGWLSMEIDQLPDPVTAARRSIEVIRALLPAPR
jgi:sugar phosphate isomerase/epimerase